MMSSGFKQSKDIKNKKTPTGSADLRFDSDPQAAAEYLN